MDWRVARYWSDILDQIRYYTCLFATDFQGMALFRPLAALRPHPNHVAQVSCPPYDVLTTDQARAVAAGKPENLLHAVLPEMDGEAEIDVLAQRGALFLERLRGNGSVMATDTEPQFYLYQQSHSTYTRMGFLGCVSVDDYRNGSIVRHELTRPKKVEERTRHLLAQQAHAEPVMLAYRNTPALKALLRSTVIDAIPLYDFTDEQHVRHRLWKADPSSNDPISAAFADMKLYIADGHHRCEAASEAARRIDEEGTGRSGNEYRYFPAVLLPDDELRILAYNRALSDIGNVKIDELSAVLGLIHLEEPSSPELRGEIVVGMQSGWYRGTLPKSRGKRLADRVDAARLEQSVLQPLYGVADVRSDPRVAFSGGSASIDEMTRGLADGTIDLAFVLHPTSIQELMEVSDAGELMPPKSTWFEPKLRSGLIIHLF